MDRYNAKIPVLFHHPRFRRMGPWILLAIVILLVIFIWRHHVNAKEAAAERNSKNQPPPVTVAVARRADVPVYLRELGSVTSVYTITVKTQINGQLWHVYYKEGQMVKAGALLAQIDPRPYLAQLTQFVGELERDTAQLANAKIDLERYKTLYPSGGISQQTYATQASLVNQLKGTIKFDQGQIQAVKVNLIYCRIVSPIDGRVGLRLVDPGNYVQTSDTTGLLVINQMNPITVEFSIPEDNVPQIWQQINHGIPLEVKAYNRDESELLDSGFLLTIDNQINTSTGTVLLRAQFPNKDYRLFPNQFVNAWLLIDTLRNATLVPSAAISHGSNGDFVYVLTPNHRVKETLVKTSVTSGDDIVVIQGISPGQSVVTQGVDKLKSGIKVNVVSPLGTS